MKPATKNDDPKSGRRQFLESTAAAAVGVRFASAAATASPDVARETLALDGGPKAVTLPDSEHQEVFRWPRYGAEEEKAVLEVLRKPDYTPIEAFEKDWKEYTGAPHVKAHVNGTSALASMFFALNLPPGSEIMTPSYTFFATIMPMRLFGLTPVFVDVNPRTLNFDLDDAKRRLTKNTKAVLPVHWLGLPCEMDQICDFAKERGLIVLEDAAHGHGARLKGKLLGNWGQASIYSYQATKPLPSIEGGMGMYKERELYERATTFGHYRLPRQFPEDSLYRKYYGTGLGLKLRMHPMAAALARVQLRGLDQRNALATGQVRRLNDRITQLPGLYEPVARADMDRVYYGTNILFIDESEAGMSRQAAVKALKAEGARVSASTYRLQHECAVYAEEEWWHHKPVLPELPGTAEVNRTAIKMPLFTSDDTDIVEQYAAAFEKVWAHRKELGKG